MSFLKQNWPWIVVPIALFALGIYVILSSADPAMDSNRYPTR